MYSINIENIQIINKKYLIMKGIKNARFNKIGTRIYKANNFLKRYEISKNKHIFITNTRFASTADI